jgi:glycine/D-amino acid oxidase-like deaminating enzyme
MTQQVVIVGGGVIGAAVACFLARDHGIQSVVLERDPNYARASSALSASSIRQQFSEPVNIALSQWSMEFLRNVGEELKINGEQPQISLVESGYLYLATPAGADVLRSNHGIQRAAGADVELLSQAQLREHFPWLAVDDLACGSLGRSGEGWFDGPALMQAFRRKAVACGARFIAAEATAFDTRDLAVRAVRCTDGQAFAADEVVLAAGAWTAPLAAKLGVVLPVAAKKRDVFVLDSPAALQDCPLVIDPQGIWFRPEGSGFIAGSPPRIADADDLPLEVDHGLFEAGLWPALARRVPAFEALRVRSAWSGYYEMNTFDYNGLVGALPGWRNVHTACGFSGHGMQQAPAIGSALAAQLAGACSTAPALGPLSLQRLVDNRPLVERNII